MQNLTKKFGLPMAICMVVGIVIGSGIFFKAQDVLEITGGNTLLGIVAWLIGGAIMVVFTATFAIMATKYEKNNGVMDYAEATCGSGYAYFIGWFLTTIYYPAMTSVLAWVCARYTMVCFFGYTANSPEALFGAPTILIAALYLVVMYFINTVSPKLAGKIQVSSTVIKLIPIVLIAIVGTVAGLVNGTLGENFLSSQTVDATFGEGEGAGLFAAVCCTAFAYEGWIIATSINAEIKDSKRNLPIALLFGSLIVVAAYVLYYVGILGFADSATLIDKGTNEAFKFFGTVGNALINFFIVVSCLGTLNGLTVALCRGMFSLAVRGEGPKPDMFSEIDKESGMPTNSGIFGLFVCILWFAFFIGGQFFGWFGEFAFDSSELPIITIYPLYVPMLLSFMIKHKELGIFKRFVLPTLCIVGAGVMVMASIFRHGLDNIWYLIVFAVVMLIGAVLYFRRRGNSRI